MRPFALLPRAIPLVGALLLMASCAPDTRAVVRAVIRDSAGVAIVDNTVPLGPEHLPWAVDTVPVIDLGARHDDPHEQFSGTPTPRRLRTGQIVVAAGETELRFFDSAGVWISSVGRSGAGPGEFRSLGWVALGSGDTVMTYDWGLHRVSAFSPDGRFVHSVTLTSPGIERAAIPLAMLGDGHILVGSTPFVRPGARSGVARDTAPILIYSPAGSPVDSLGRFPGSESLIQGTESSVMVMSCPFGKELVLAVAPGAGTIYLGTQDAPEVRLWEPTGRLTRVVRWHETPVPVTESDRTLYLQAMAERARPGQEEFQQRLERMVREAALPSHKPAYAGLVIGPDRTLWVQAYTAPDRTRPVPYQVFDSTGQWLGPITLPPRFTASQIGEGFVLGTWTDEDDVNHVRLYRLIRRQPA